MGEATDLFGSGWVWLVKNHGQQLEIVSTPNAGLRVHDEKMHPLLVVDVWEHAYYIDYRNERARYLEKFFDIVSWKAVGDRFAARRA